MKGLMLKDFYNLKKSVKTTAIILIFYGIFGIVTGQASFLSAMIAVLCAVLPISSFSYDDFSKWDFFLLSMPVSRKTVVMSKYVMALLMLLVGCGLSLLMGGLTILLNRSTAQTFIELLSSVGTVAVLCVFIISLTLPVIVKFGVERGRIAMIASFLIPTLLFVLIAKSAGTDWLPTGEALSDLLFAVAIAAPIIALAALGLSFLLSLRFYEAKEF